MPVEHVHFKGTRVAFSVLGRVSTLNGAPEGGLAVEGFSADGHVEEAVTEADGTFRLLGLKPGASYTVRVKDRPCLETGICMCKTGLWVLRGWHLYVYDWPLDVTAWDGTGARAARRGGGERRAGGGEPGGGERGYGGGGRYGGGLCDVPRACRRVHHGDGRLRRPVAAHPHR
eukprot:1177192-Prorocentrum_minimum.AAC.1